MLPLKSDSRMKWFWDQEEKEKTRPVGESSLISQNPEQLPLEGTTIGKKKRKKNKAVSELNLYLNRINDAITKINSHEIVSRNVLNLFGCQTCRYAYILDKATETKFSWEKTRKGYIIYWFQCMSPRYCGISLFCISEVKPKIFSYEEIRDNILFQW